MKLILVICAVISMVDVFANGFSNNDVKYDFDVSDIDLLPFGSMLDGGLPITEEQIQCIRDEVQKVVDENPDLKWWFDEVDKSVTKLHESAKKCDTLVGIDQKRCFLKLKVAAQIELRRLVKLLPADQKEVLETLKSVIKGCLD